MSGRRQQSIEDHNEESQPMNQDKDKLNQEVHATTDKDCCDTALGVFLPPVYVYKRHGCTNQFWICLVLTICLLVPGSIYAFVSEGMPCCDAVLCLFLPPLGLYCKKGVCCDFAFLICCILSCTWLGGSFWAFWHY